MVGKFKLLVSAIIILFALICTAVAWADIIVTQPGGGGGGAGPTGPTGPSGPSGPTGPAGSDGADGVSATFPALQIVTAQPAELSMSMPPYRVPTVIASLGTSITRISDATTFGAGDRNYRHVYAKKAAWNADGSRALLAFRDGESFLLDGKTYELLATFAVNSEPTWSNTDPRILYGTGSGGQLIERTLAYAGQGTTRTVVTVGGGAWGATYIGIGEGNGSNDGRYLPLVGTVGADTQIAVIDLQTETAGTVLTLTGMAVNTNIDWVGMSQSGNYVIVAVSTVGSEAYRVYDRATMTLARTIDTTGASGGLGHADLCYDGDGDEVLVTMRSDNAHANYIDIEAWDLSDGTSTVVLDAVNMASNYHISCRNIDRPGFAYLSTYADPGNDDTKRMWNEVFALKLDGSGKVERWGQAFRSDTPTDITYDRQAQAVPNRDGSKVMFASDWADASGTAIVYDYVLERAGAFGATGLSSNLRVNGAALDLAPSINISGLTGLLALDGVTMTNNTIGATNAINAAALTAGVIPDARMPNLTGDCTTAESAVAVTCQPAIITGKSTVTPTGSDELLISDASDSGNLKRVTVQSVVDLASGGSGVPDPSAYAYIAEEFAQGQGSPGMNGAWNLLNSGAGAGWSQATSPLSANEFGVMSQSTGTTATGTQSTRHWHAAVTAGGGTITSWCKIRYPALSDGTDTFLSRCGLIDDDAGVSNDGIYFSYTHGLNAGEFEGYVCQGGICTSCDTNVAVAINTWYSLKAVTNSAGTSTEFFINGVSACTNSGTHPSAGDSEWTNIGVTIEKTAGTTARTQLLDYLAVRKDFTTAR